MTVKTKIHLQLQIIKCYHNVTINNKDKAKSHYSNGKIFG